MTLPYAFSTLFPGIRLLQFPPSTVSSSDPEPFNERYEVHDPFTFTTHISPQRQQHQKQSSSHTVNPVDPALPAQEGTQPQSRPLSPNLAGNPRHIRRTTRLTGRPPSDIGPATAAFPEQLGRRSTSVRFADQPEFVDNPRPPTPRRNSYSEPYTEGEEDWSSHRASLGATGESYWPKRSNRVSPRTASAILWTLEEAIRRPFLFTPDVGELNASMSELAGGGQPSGPTGNGRPQNGSSRPTATMGGNPAPPPLSTHPPSGVRTPTEIMRQRRDREARKRAEQGAREQEAELQHRHEQEQQQAQLHAEAQAQLQQQFSQSGRQQPQAAGVAGETAPPQRRQTVSRPPDVTLPQNPAIRHDRGGAPTRLPTTSSSSGGVTAGMQPTVPAATRPQDILAPDVRVSGDFTQQAQPTTRQRGSSVSQGQPRSAATQGQPTTRIPSSTYASQIPQTSQTRPVGAPAQGATQQPHETGTSSIPQTQHGSQTQRHSGQQGSQSQTHAQQQQPRPRAAFPHAFERWETLSSHWEGLTGYWIRRLEQNSEELSRDPVSQQLSRQVTDLSAAGANLFHAVVELQRLRASSERKFQRWFFDTRAEQERSQEVRAELERLLRTERQAHSEVVAATSKAQEDKAKAEELAKEMRRELQISKEEARRAWEELGRREQEERDRTLSLRSGEPTIVGGVQVVPMVQGVPSRQTSTNQHSTREGGYAVGGMGPGTTTSSSAGGQARQGATEHEQYGYDSQVSSPAATDPFTESSRAHQDINVSAYGAPLAQHQPPSSSAAMSAAQDLPAHSAQPSHGRFYQHEGPSLHGGEHRIPEADERSYAPSTEGGSDVGSEEFDVGPEGSYRHQDPHGQQLVYPRTISDDSDDYDNPEQLGPEGEYSGGRQPSSHYGGGGGGGGPGLVGAGYGPGPAPTSSPEEIHLGYGQGVDYSGSGWGSGWDSFTPRHRHPTRLSDVLEEDERSRTTPSRTSQASRTMH